MANSLENLARLVTAQILKVNKYLTNIIQIYQTTQQNISQILNIIVLLTISVE